MEKNYLGISTRKPDKKELAFEDTQATLMKSEQKYRRLVEVLGENYFFYTHDTMGIFTAISPSITTVLGYTPEEFTHVAEYLVDNPLSQAGMHHTKFSLQGIKQPPFEIEIPQKDGSNKIVEITEEPVFDNNGQVVEIEGIGHDVTAMRHLENQLHQARKMEAIGLLASGVAHDLNNILSGVIGYPEMLLKSLPQNSELRGTLEVIRDSGQRAAVVVADLLTAARGSVASRKVYCLNTLVLEYLDSPECKKLNRVYPRVSCQHQLSASRAEILCSSVHIKKCLMNLVINAVEAIVSMGTVVVSTENLHIGGSSGFKPDLEPGDYVLLSIRDTGPGISKEDMEHIFKPFYTRKTMGKSGSGLGLNIVWNSVEDHGGKIFVESSKKGTCFQLYFPVSQENGNIHTKKRSIGKLSGNGEHILVVDDEPLLLELTGQMLEYLGYKVNCVRSGELAIDFVRENSVDLIVLDMQMAPGINGRQTFDKICEMYPGQKALIASGFEKNDDVKRMMERGAGAFIKKPYITDQLGKVVKEVLSKQQLQEAYG